MADETPDTDTLEAAETPEEPADEPLGEPGVKALEREREARKDAERRAAELEDRLEQVERNQMLRQVAQDKGLTDAQAARLEGDTREELEADADELLDAFADDEEAIPRVPREKLRSGATATAETEDTGAIADRLVGGW